MKNRRSYRWSPGDLLDYEVLLSRDTPTDSDDQCKHQWFLSYKGSPKPRILLHSWVLSRRNQAQQTDTLPGSTVEHLYNVICVSLLFIGLLTGAGLGWGLLAYAGADAVNLLLTLAILFALPFLITIISFLLNIFPAYEDRSRRLMDRMIRMLNRISGFARRIGMMDKAHDDAVSGSLAQIREQSSRYASLVRWMVSIPVQIRALGFHFGIFIAVLWRGVVQDLAFGWQTTLRVSAEQIYQRAYDIAWPWRALISPPTLTQVEGSRIVLKEGLSNLNNSDLVSWWPYVCCAVLAYGVVTRLLLLIYGLIRQRLSILNLSFTDSRSRYLMSALRSSSLTVTGKEPGRELFNSITEKSEGLSINGKSLKLTVLYPELREDLAVEQEWKRFLLGMWKADLSSLAAVSQDDEDDKNILESLAALNKRQNGVIIAFEGWRPYTASAALFVDAVYSYIPSGLPVLIVLSGRPGEAAAMRDEDRETFRQWRQLLPAAVSSGSCEVVEFRSFE